MVNIADKITEDEDSGSHKRGFMRAIQKYNHHKNHASDLSADQVKLENLKVKNNKHQENVDNADVKGSVVA